MRFDSLAEWLSWQETFHPKSIDLGLDRVRTVYRSLNALPCPFTITVAGTNGKGSCVALLEAILRAAGYRVGAYTSPHLLHYNERIRIDGEPVRDQAICTVFERIDQARQGISLSFFEFGTLTALQLFAEAGVDVQILEVGLGGRLDAVNLIDADVMLITSIAVDHSDWLGESREAIGLEKAGVLRPDKPAVIGDPNPPRSILHYAADQRIALDRLGHTFGYEQHPGYWSWYNTHKRIQRLPWPALQGEHQFRNAASVLQLLHLMRAQRPVTEQALHQGLRSVQLPGRFQWIDATPPLLLDVAHNPQAAESLAVYIQQYHPQRRVRAVFSIMKDKDIAGVIMAMRATVQHWYFAPLPMPRCAGPAELEAAFQDCNIQNYTVDYSGFEAAFSAARRQAAADDLIIIFGSFFWVAEYYSHTTREAI